MTDYPATVKAGTNRADPLIQIPASTPRHAHRSRSISVMATTHPARIPQEVAGSLVDLSRADLWVYGRLRRAYFFREYHNR